MLSLTQSDATFALSHTLVIQTNRCWVMTIILLHMDCATHGQSSLAGPSTPACDASTLLAFATISLPNDSLISTLIKMPVVSGSIHSLSASLSLSNVDFFFCFASVIRKPMASPIVFLTISP